MSSNPKPPAQRFGPYHIRDKIGAGSATVVYRADLEGEPQPVALKLLRPELAKLPSLNERFQAEMTAAARFRHPHLLPIISYGAPKGRVFIELPYMARGSLARRFATVTHISPQESIRLLRHIAAALDTLHRQGGLYEHWKLENILQDERSDAFLADIALARMVGFDLSKRLQAGTAIYFTAPEALRGSPSQRSDFYALAVLAYVMLVGRFPFSEGSLSDIVRAHVSAPIPAPTSIVPTLPTALDAVLQKALSKKPEERFTLADTFIEALARVFPDEYKAYTTVNLWGVEDAEPETQAGPSPSDDEPRTADEWFARAQTAPSDAEKIACLKRALALEPWHTAANRQLMQLEGPKTLYTQTQTVRVVAPTAANAPSNDDLNAADMPDMAELVPLKKARPPRRRTGLPGSVILLGFIALALASSVFVLNFFGLLPSGTPQTINGTPVDSIPGIAGTPLRDIPGIVMTLSPNQSRPIEDAGTVGDTLGDGGLHEYIFSANRGQETAILIQFLSLNANNVSRHVAIIRPDGSNASGVCQSQRVLQIEGDTGLGFTCAIDQNGDWKVRIYGVQGESTGAYFVTVGTLD